MSQGTSGDVELTDELIVEPIPELLTKDEVRTLFRVDPKTVMRWAKAGKLTLIRTPGGHPRFRSCEVIALLHGEDPEPAT